MSWVIGARDDWGCDTVPLGFPLNNTDFHIVDGPGTPVFFMPDMAGYGLMPKGLPPAMAG